MFDATLGRFLQRDPAGADGTNLYEYVQSDPVTLADPLGEASTLSSGPNSVTVYGPRAATPEEEKKQREPVWPPGVDPFNPGENKPMFWTPFLGGTIEIKFDPSKSKEVICCDEIVHVQVVSTYMHGEPYISSDGQWHMKPIVSVSPGKVWGHLAPHALDNTALDVGPSTGNPVVQDHPPPWKADVGPQQQVGSRKADGSSRVAVAVDAPGVTDVSNGRGTWAVFETFPCCRKGKDKGKFYNGGVRWQALPGGVLNVLDPNLGKPANNSTFMKAYQHFVKTTGKDPCKPK
jgi:hypothetical protein